MNLTKFAQQSIEAVLAVVGVRVGTEEPSYTRRSLTAAVDIRRYGPRIAAETTVAADENRAQRRLPSIGGIHFRRQPHESGHLDDRTGQSAFVGRSSRSR